MQRSLRMALGLFLPVILLLVIAGSQAGDAQSGRKIIILFTHDLHSHFLPDWIAIPGGGRAEQGGYARLAYLIHQLQSLNKKQTLLVDGGDFSMGTLFHTNCMTEATELKLMGKMGYEVTTFGNHEFDIHPDGLAKMLEAAKSNGGRLPEMVSSNIVFTANSRDDASLKQAFRDFPVREYTVIEKNGIRVGVFGIMGKDAADDSPFAAPVTFADPVKRSRAVVDILKHREKVDLIVCLSHSGTSAIKKHSEDEVLAREVPEIDVIISGHTHTVLPKPITVGKTTIVSAGCYGAYLGMLDLEYSPEKGAKLSAYSLKEISSDIPEDTAMASYIASFKEQIDERYLHPYHYHYDQTIAESGFNMDFEAYGNAESTETGLGDMVTDAFRYAVQKAEGNKYEPIDLVIDPQGVIRDSFLKGPITVADIFKVLSLGIGMDGNAGYPLIACYITGDDVKRLLEVDTTVAKLKGDAHLQVSGIKFTYNPHRVPFDRVTSVEIREANGGYLPLETGRLYRICMNIYTAQMVDYVRRVSYGLIAIHPKDRHGNTIADLKEARIDADGIAPGVQELKEWVALTTYMESFPHAGQYGIPTVPLRYRTPGGRIIIQPSWNPLELIRGGLIITYGIVMGGVLLLLVMALLVRAIVRHINRHSLIKPAGLY